MPTVAFVMFDGFYSMALAAQPVFEFTNVELGESYYQTLNVSDGGGPVRASSGLTVLTEPIGDRIFDTVVFVGGNPAATEPPAGVLAYVRRSAATARRTASICTGAFVLAEAGLLDGRRATTHWHYAHDLRTRYPSVTVDDDRIFIVDGPVWTSAGMTAGIDLALALVEKDLGAKVARAVARNLVVYHWRSGGQSQHSALLELEPKSDRIQSALTYAKQKLAEPLSVEQLADVARLSPRQFSRAFRAETGQSPAKAVERLRLEAARLMLEESRHTIDHIAGVTGFSDPRRMREAFVRIFGQPPQAFRRNARVVTGGT
ncbi:GlxA family transcriptional regulator [Paraburkholderia aromaticivorans]|uniref:GlxA family transcriptional regulator n=1 Tax=Paraburkholderia aromaticivorans TaxID=2026199 RepID=UPI001456129E|nr:GlxA family transcriptional regulator [Paraburkholderia aromaticivorans]